MKPPISSISIGGQPFQVALEPMEEWGQFYADSARIAISDQCDPCEFFATLKHEILHAALWVSGATHLLDPKAEEAIVRAIENIALPAFRVVDEAQAKKRISQ